VTCSVQQASTSLTCGNGLLLLEQKGKLSTIYQLQQLFSKRHKLTYNVCHLML